MLVWQSRGHSLYFFLPRRQYFASGKRKKSHDTDRHRQGILFPFRLELLLYSRERSADLLGTAGQPLPIEAPVTIQGEGRRGRFFASSSGREKEGTRCERVLDAE